MGRIKVNWVSVIKEHIIKIRKKVEYKISYVVLISQFIEYFEIDTDGEVVEMVKVHNEVTKAILNKIELIKVNDEKWICNANFDSSNEQSAEAEEEEEEEDEDEEDDNVDDVDEPMADVPQSGYEQYFVGFEERMMN